MEWSVVALIMGVLISFLAFLWGIFKIFKKPHEDKSWEAPIIELKKSIKLEEKECQQGFDTSLKIINDTLIIHGNKIHDLEKDKELMNSSLKELKDDVKLVGLKCDKILDKVIEYISKDNQ